MGEVPPRSEPVRLPGSRLGERPPDALALPPGCGVRGSARECGGDKAWLAGCEAQALR